MADKNRPIILVIHDDPLVRLPMTLELEEAGFVVLQAVDGRHAVELLCAHPKVQAAVIDLDIPADEGLHLVAVLQVDWPDVAIVAIAQAEPEGSLPGGAIFIAKPCAEHQLVAAVEVALLTEQFGLR